MSESNFRDPENAYPISRERYEVMKPLLPVARREVVPQYVFVNAVAYLLLHLGKWRTLHGRYRYEDGHGVRHPVSWQAGYQRFRYWVDRGVIATAFTLIRDALYEEGADLVAVDSTCVKLAPSAYGRHDPTIGRSVGGWTTKIHVFTSNDGFPYHLHLTGGNRHDGRVGEILLETVEISRFRYLTADMAYVSRRFRRMVEDQGVTTVIPPRRDLKDPWGYDRELYKRRAIVEQFNQRLKRYAHISCRYERRADMFLAFVHLACILNYLLIEHTSVEGTWKNR